MSANTSERRTDFDDLTPPSLRDGHRPYVLQTARFGYDVEEIKRRFLRDPENAPSEVLPLLIAEYSLEEFIEPGLSEDAQRALLKIAPRLHQIKGKPEGIRYALQALGVHAEFTDWFETVPHGPDGTHEITAYVGDQLFPGHELLSPKVVRQIWRLINEMKRWSQRTYLNMGERFDHDIFIRALTKAIMRSEAEYTPKPRAQIALSGPSLRSHVALTVKSQFTHDILNKEAV